MLDIGSNTVHMIIVDAAPGARPRPPKPASKTTVRLMQYLEEDGTISKDGVQALLAAVEAGMKLAEESKVSQIPGHGHIRSAPRRRTGTRILGQIEDRIGQGVTVLSGVDEARLAACPQCMLSQPQP